MKTSRGDAILRATEIAGTTLVPEIRLHLLRGGLSFDALHGDDAADFGGSVPYWAVAWPGGQALARFILDHPGRFLETSVVDYGCGCGIAAIAAAKAGASLVIGLDRNPVAIAASRLNSCLNDVSVHWRVAEIDAEPAHGADYVLAGDVWYERFDARKVTDALRKMAVAGRTVLCGDVGRAHFPRTRTARLASYDIEATHGFEKSGRIVCSVWALEP